MSEFPFFLKLNNIPLCVLCFVVPSLLIFCNPLDCSLPDSSAHGIFQSRILEWVAISSSRGSFPAQGQNPVSPAMHLVSCITSRLFTAEPPGKPKYSSRTCLNFFLKSYTLFTVITKYWLYSLCCFVQYTLVAYLTRSVTLKLF